MLVNGSSGVCMCMLVCVYMMGLEPCCYPPPPPAQAEAGVWMGARSSELIFTIMFLL